jgi:hypothetical protein
VGGFLLPQRRVIAQTVGHAGALKGDLDRRNPALVLELEQARHYPVAQGFRVNGVDVDFGAALKSGRGGDAPFDQHPPRHRHVGIRRLIRPFLIAGNVRAGSGVAGVNQIGHAAQFVRRVIPRLAAFALGENLQSGVAMAEAGKGNGVIIFGDDQVAVGGEIDRRFVIKVGVEPHPLQFHLVQDAAFVNRNQLFMQMIEGSAGRFQPVLKHGHIADIAVIQINVAGGVNGEAQILVVLFRAKGSRRGQLTIVDGAIDEMTPGDDDFMTAAEKGVG